MVDDVGLVGKLLDDLGLGAAEHEGGNHALELSLSFLVSVLLDGYDVFLHEAVERPQQAGVEELEEVPQLGEVVLYGCAGEDDTMLPLEFHGGG